MDQPFFSCTKCLLKFPHSQMSRSGTTCKSCSTHHSSFKQCEYCKSDFKHSTPGLFCLRCQHLKSKYGSPKSCTICTLKMAFGNSLVCQRCLHYRTKFGDPRQCEGCLKICSFYKDEASRNKVDNKLLCWICTYNYKITKMREQPDHGTNKHRFSSSFSDKTSKDHGSYESVKRQRTEDYLSQHSNTQAAGSINYSLDPTYNEHLLTIGQLQDEVKKLKQQIAQKESEIVSKECTITELNSDIEKMQIKYQERLTYMQESSDADRRRFQDLIRALQRDRSDTDQRSRSRKKVASGLRDDSIFSQRPDRLPQPSSLLSRTRASTPVAVPLAPAQAYNESTETERADTELETCPAQEVAMLASSQSPSLSGSLSSDNKAASIRNDLSPMSNKDC